MTFDTLVAEPVQEARLREREAFAKLAGGAKDRLVLFGAGQLGRKILVILRRHGVEPLAFADNNSAIHGCQIEGLTVLSPTDAAKRYGANAVFVVTIFRGMGDEGMASRLRLLTRSGCRLVAPFLPLVWQFGSEFFPHYGATLPSTLLAAASDLTAVNTAWCDAESREVFLAQLLWRLRGDFSTLNRPSPDQYFPRDLFALNANDSFVDGGAYDGDTLRVLGANFTKAWAIEPDPANADRLRELSDPRIDVLECALGAVAGEARFTGEGGVASALSTTGVARVRVDTLDHLLGGESPTFLKLDIEGSEQTALEGAKEMLGRCRPIVAICVYHRPDDLWKIPLFLRQTLPEHRLFLRAHQNDGYELVVYAVPLERALA